MKRTFTILLFIVLWSLSQGQNLTVSLPNVTATPNTDIYIPVKLSGASSSGVPISSANIQITYDTAVLTFDTLANFYSGTPVAQWFFSGHDGLVSANWLEPSLGTLAIPNNTTLYEMKFTYKGGTSPLNFVVFEFTDAVYNLIPTTPTNGSVTSLVPHQVTFKVDMSKETVSPNGVHIAGSFNNWNYTQNPMILTSNGIYTTTISLQDNATIQYRFVNGNSATGLENVPSNCGVPNGSGSYDRQITVPHHDTAYVPVCFGMCSHCPASVSVTFCVDMQNETISPNSVHVAGTFNNWNYSQTTMTHTTGSVYHASVTLQEGNFIEFKYANGNTAQDAETLPDDCTINGNRYLTVPAHDTTITAYCFNSCVVCGGIYQYVQVTFKVDMRAQVVSTNGVHIAGTFQGWNPGSHQMTPFSDSLYFTRTDSLLVGTSVEYRFVNGNTTTDFEIVPSACSSNGNRTMLIPDHDTIATLVCFAECDTCIIDGIKTLQGNSISLGQNFPNPATECTQIGYSVITAGDVTLSLHNPLGKLVKVLYAGHCTPGSYSIPIRTTGLLSGIYYYQMIFTGETGTYTQCKKMIVE